MNISEKDFFWYNPRMLSTVQKTAILLLILFAACTSDTKSVKDTGYRPMEIIITPGHDARDAKKAPDVRHEDIGHVDPGTKDPGISDPGTPDPGQKDPGGYDPGPIDTGCEPNCVNRECGSNGCGGSCGKCKAGNECINHKCLCLPDCAGKKCGDNGCGGQCGTCPDYSQCIEGEGKCAVYGECSGKNNIFCYTPNDPNGDTNAVSGNNGTSWINSDKIDLYDCNGGTMASGAEVVYKFSSDQTGTVTLNFSPKASYLNLYVLKGSCNGRECSAMTHGTTTVNVTKGETWFFIVDATENKTAGYKLRAECSWVPLN